MLWAGASDVLEIRAGDDGSHELSGTFPYNSNAVLSDGGRNGRPKKERFASRAFSYRVERPEEDIHLLLGHDYNRPLASRGAGTLDLIDGDDALTLRAIITRDIAETSHGKDTLNMIRAGLAVGLSPGFRLPPERAVPRDSAERIHDEPHRPAEGMHRAIIREIMQALLYELSIVTRPAYPTAQVEARSWDNLNDNGLKIRTHGAMRWR